MSYFYRAFGFRIDSTTQIPALEPPQSGPTLFSLRFDTGPEPEWARHASSLPGRVRSHLPGNKTLADPAFVLTERGGGKFFDLFYSDGARFVVDETAERVWGTTEPQLPPEDLFLYFLGPVMGFLLRHRHVTSIHASAVELRDRAVLFSGYAGRGKSTTAAALALRGIPVMCEDIVPLELTKSLYWAIPAYPRICLWPDSVVKLVGDREAFPRLSPEWDKRYLPLDGLRAKFASEKKPLGVIYLFGPRSPEDSAPRIEELRPREALLELVKNTYMNWLLDRERRAEEFDELHKVVQQVPVRRVVAHADGEKIGELCDLILEDAGNLLAGS